MSVGYIYILSNSAMQGLLKIGITSRDVRERVTQLSAATGVPRPFEIKYYCLTRDPDEIERSIREHFSSRRAGRKKEFFEISLLEAVQFIDSIIKPVQPDRYCTEDGEVTQKAPSQTSQQPQQIRPRRPREDKPFDPEALKRWQEKRLKSNKPLD